MMFGMNLALKQFLENAVNITAGCLLMMIEVCVTQGMFLNNLKRTF